MENQDFEEGLPLADAIDHEILMHREAHFGGQFPIMLEYYQQEGKGIQPEFNLERIEKLALLEKALQTNLAALYLAGREAERVADAKQAYQNLREIYELNNLKNPVPRLIADLILSEDEEAEEEVAALVAEKDRAVPALINLLRSEEFYDPLFPGYGLSPALAVKCLGQIGDKRAIIALFEAFGQGDFFADDAIVKALKEIGEPAKEFLLRVVKGHPVNEDNERAAIALIGFKDDPEVAKTCFDLLQRADVQKDPCLPTYLVLACSGLYGMPEQKSFMELAQRPDVPKILHEDIVAVIHEWENREKNGE